MRVQGIKGRRCQQRLVILHRLLPRTVCAHSVKRPGGGAVKQLCAQQGVRLVLEHLTPQSSNLLTSADKVSRMVRSIGRKNLGVALDLGQMSVFGESVSDYFGPLGDKIWMVHIMDGAPGRHLAFGDGILPLQAYCRQLRRAGYQGPITLEINDAQYAKAPEAALQQCLRAMAQWEEEAP